MGSGGVSQWRYRWSREAGLCFFYSLYGDRRALHSFPARRSSSLTGRSHLGAGLVKVRLVANTTDHHGERCSGHDLNGTKLRREEPLPPRLAKRRVGRLGAADFVQHAGGEIGRDRRVRQCGQQVVELFPPGLISGVRSQPEIGRAHV